MPRYPRQESPTGVYHFINRGVNKKKLFHRSADFETYKGLIHEYRDRFGIEIYHYCLMANHTHLVLKAPDSAALSQFAHYLQRRYAYYYCKTNHWSEQVFRKRFISIALKTDAQLLECGRYVERNSLNANIVKNAEDYPYTSYPYYAYNKPDRIVNESPLFGSLGNTQGERQRMYRFYVSQERGYEMPEPVKGELATF